MTNKPKIKLKFNPKLKPKQQHIKPNFSVIKTSLKSILKNYHDNFPIINQLVIDCHQIVTRTYQFIRLYLLNQFMKGYNMNSIRINKDFILSCIRVCGHSDARGRPPKKTDIENELSHFYDQEFEPCIHQSKFDLKYKSFIIPYLAVQIQTSFENNITEHFLQRIRKIMNLSRPSSLTDDNLFKKIKNWILMNRHDLIPEDYKIWGHEIKGKYLPDEYQNCYGYDVKVNPQKYLSYLIRMNQFVEQKNQTIQDSQLSEEEKKRQIQRLFQPIPLRSSKIPCYVTLDANSIVSIFYRTDKAKISSNIADHREEVWSYLFKTDEKVMKKKGYHFRSIQTDGVGVSICFQKNGMTFKEKHLKGIEQPLKSLEDLDPNEIMRYRDKKLVGADPGKQSSIYMIDEQKNHLRYTPRQRRAESQNLICHRIMESEKENYGVKEIESQLSKYNSKTVNYQLFKDYLREESKFNDQMDRFYQQEIWRKMKWRVWINRRRSEDQFLNRIKESYGDPGDVLICYGNWSESQPMKYVMPSQGVGLRRLISRRFETVMVDECRTSKLCNQCHQKLEQYLGEKRSLYRVLVCRHCQSNRSESKCCFFNRDANAGMNMLYLTKMWLQTQMRPLEYKRTMSPTCKGKPGRHDSI